MLFNYWLGNAPLTAATTTTTEQLGTRHVWTSLVWMLVKKELKVRYKGSIFGYLWSMLNPLLYMVILTFVFSHIMRFDKENYALFILTGILIWNFFSQGAVLGVGSILGNASLMKKVKVSATIFTAASVGSVLVNFVLSLVPFLLISLYQTGTVLWTALLLPVVLLPLVLFTFGVALALGSLNVLYRDVQHLIEPVLNLLFYATPIIYPIDAIPENYRWVLQLNPLAYFVSAARELLYSPQGIGSMSFVILYVFGIVAMAIGFLVYSATRKQFIYRL